MSPKKVLILYTSHTLGHKTVAENIGYHLAAAGYQVELFDALETEKSSSISGFLAVHTFINKYVPFIWRWMYLTGYMFVVPVLKFMARFHSSRILALIDRLKPDMVITTQISPSGAVSYLKHKGLFVGKFGIAFSDFHLHPSWIYPNADFYLANTEEQKQAMIALGVTSDKIFVTGITVKPKQDVNTEEIRQKFNIPKESKVILVSSGSLGIRLPENIIDILRDEVHLAIREQGKVVHTIIICGNNNELYKDLSKENTDEDFHILGFHSPMSELYAIADVYITKAGGLSVIESLQWNLPLIVTHILPGQEELNVQYLSSAQLVTPLYVKPKRMWAGLIIEELLSGKLRAELSKNSKAAKMLELSSGKPVIMAIEQEFHGAAKGLTSEKN